MPARIVVVHDDPEFTDALVEKLGPDVAWFTDPVRALIALESARTVAFLITRLQFTDSQPVGLSLARLASVVRPDVRVVFTGVPEHEGYARELGEFIAEPVNAAHVAVIIEWLSRREGTRLTLLAFGGQTLGRTGSVMTDESYDRKLAELDSPINDPDMPLSPARIWQLMGEISQHAENMTNMDQERRRVAAE